LTGSHAWGYGPSASMTFGNFLISWANIWFFHRNVLHNFSFQLTDWRRQRRKGIIKRTWWWQLSFVCEIYITKQQIIYIYIQQDKLSLSLNKNGLLVACCYLEQHICYQGSYSSYRVCYVYPILLCSQCNKPVYATLAATLLRNANNVLYLVTLFSLHFYLKCGTKWVPVIT
jgi:hypothetical protein